MDNLDSKILVVGVLPESLLNFRGELIQALKAKGHTVLTVSEPSSETLVQDFRNKGVDHSAIRFKRSGLNPLTDLSTCFALYRLYKKENPKKVLAYTIKPVIWGGIAAAFAKVPFYALVTGLGFAFQGESFKRKLLTKLVSFLYKVALSHATKIIFQNDDNRSLFVEKGIVPFVKTEVVNGSGVDLSQFSSVALPSYDFGVQFLCIARLLGEKGLREYARAAEIVKAKYRDASFTLVGPEDTSPDGISIKEVKTWSAINYQGSAKDVRSFIEKAHVYVLPSYHEGLPRSTIEAMAIGRPIITTDAVGCKETVEEGVNGFKVPVGDENALAEKMIWFIENPEKIETMGLVSRKMAEEKFDVDKVNARMLEIIGLS